MMPDSSITIPHSNLAEALSTAQALRLILGKECLIDFSTYALTADLDAIDREIEASLDEPDTTPTDPNAPVVQVADTTPRTLTRDIYPTEQQQAELDALLMDRRLMTLDNEDAQSAWIAIQREKQQIREAAIAPYLGEHITPGSTLIYGNTPVPNAEVIPYFDGKFRTVDTLIHWSNAVSPEDDYLRGLRVSCRLIVRFHVWGIDADEDRDEPRYALDDGQWRSLLYRRLTALPVRHLSIERSPSEPSR